MAAVAAHADEAVAANTINHYHYEMHLDIAHVVSQVEAQDVNGITSVQLTYTDTRGVSHILEYNTISIGTPG